ncbi:MAG: EF-hand domain-containing protein [Myxococcota bacterium]
MSVEEELVSKIQKLMQARFGGTDRAARERMFAAYDHDQDGHITKDELSKLLEDAGVCNGLTRGFWVKGVMSHLDRDDSATIDFAEFEHAVGMDVPTV